MMEDGVQGGRARASACMGCNANDLFVASSSRATRRAMEPGRGAGGDTHGTFTEARRVAGGHRRRTRARVKDKALARAASNNCQGRLIVNAMGCGVRIESMQREGLDETFGIVGVPIVGVGVGGDFEGGEIDLISQQTADAAETTAKLVTLLRLIRDEFQDATKLLVLVC